MDTWQRERARVATHTRHHGPDDPRTALARRDLRAARLAEHITRTVDAAPPLTPEQRDRLAMLLHGRPATVTDRPTTRPAA